MLLTLPGFHKCQFVWCVSYTILQRKNIDKGKELYFYIFFFFFLIPDIVDAPFFLR